MRTLLQILFPVLILSTSGGIATWLIKNKKEIKPQPRKEIIPLVEVRKIEPGEHQFRVHTQGEIAPRTQIELVSEVSGKVIWVNETFAIGGFFKTNDVLIKLDPNEFVLVVTQAEATLARARVGLSREEAEVQVAREEWKALGSEEKKADPLVLREPQLAGARATVASAEAALAKARLDLARCEIRAPYDGRVRQKHVDVGQFINRGTPIGRVYAVDFVEIRLPIPLDETGFLQLPSGLDSTEAEPIVALAANLGGRESTWSGRVVRTEGEINARTRMLNAVARIDDPFGLRSKIRNPLPVGLFVKAEVLGRKETGVYRVPRSSIRGKDHLLTVDSEDRLRLRKVEILRYRADDVLLRSGLEEGDRVCLSLVDAPVDGMEVRVRDVDLRSVEQSR